MGSNRFKMTAQKTQLIWLGTKQRDKISVTELPLLCARVTLFVNGSRPRLSSGQPDDHERPGIGSVSVLLLAAMSTPTRHVVVDV